MKDEFDLKINYSTINISLNNNPIQNLITTSLSTEILQSILERTLIPTVKNINMLKNLQYDFNLEQDQYCYLETYISYIGKLLFSLNSFLLQVMYKYCTVTGVNYYKTLSPTSAKLNEDIFHKKNNNNTINELINFFVIKNFLPENSLYISVIYEFIFRHQHAHGWNLFFYALLEEMKNLETKFDYNKLDDFDNVLTNANSDNQGEIRKQLKQKSLSYSVIDLKPYIEYDHSLSYTSLELVFKINSEYNPGSILALEKYSIDTSLNSSNNVNSKVINDNLLNIYQKNHQNGKMTTKILGLNNLSKYIYGIVTEIDEKLNGIV